MRIDACQRLLEHLGVSVAELRRVGHRRLAFVPQSRNDHFPRVDVTQNVPPLGVALENRVRRPRDEPVARSSGLWACGEGAGPIWRTLGAPRTREKVEVVPRRVREAARQHCGLGRADEEWSREDGSTHRLRRLRVAEEEHALAAENGVEDGEESRLEATKQVANRCVQQLLRLEEQRDAQRDRALLPLHVADVRELLLRDALREEQSVGVALQVAHWRQHGERQRVQGVVQVAALLEGRLRVLTEADRCRVQPVDRE